jgi:hypothetical protein
VGYGTGPTAGTKGAAMSSHIKVSVYQGTNPKRFHMQFSEDFGSDYAYHTCGHHHVELSEHMRYWIMNLRVAYDIRVQHRHISFIQHNHIPLDRTITTIIEQVMSFMVPQTVLVYMPR